MSVFKPVTQKMDFPGQEEAVLEFWQKQNIFQKQLAQNSEKRCLDTGRPYKQYVFFEGPPTANGIPHPGHILTRVIKDVFLRYKSMQGYDVVRKAGWDTHGLPVEIEVEKRLGIDGKENIEKYGIEPFVKECKNSVFKYSDVWSKMTERIGFWIDLDQPYITYTQDYIESVWWALKAIWEAGLLYHGHKIVPYCPRCGTALSSHEVGQGYKEVSEPSVFVTFKVKGENNLSLLAWTTTPWTLPSNVALAIGAEFDYDYVKVENEVIIIASELREKCLGKIPHQVEKQVKGSDLLNLQYEQIFTYGKVDKPAFRVIAADFVGLDSGSGIVHIAPAFGEDDYKAGIANELPMLNLVQPDGTFKSEVEPWKGMFVKDADKLIIKALRERKQLLKSEQYTHPYPFCWRCDSPLIYYARPAWYIRTTSIKDEMLENNRKIEWLPKHIKDGRFGNFLATNIDWALSRERYWGTPLPIWSCQSCNYQHCIGSLQELQELAESPVEELELHKPYVDTVELTCQKCSGKMKRVSEVIDCWFDAGSMPFAQWGYPHKKDSHKQLEKLYPAMFITEAIDQTRGWFYTLLAIATLLRKCGSIQAEQVADPEHPRTEVEKNLKIFKDTPLPIPYRRCLVLGHVCDAEGYKMSKSKGNYLDPWEILNTNGADAMRWYFYAGNNPWVSVRFFKNAIRDAQKDFLIRLRNVHQFFVIYANIDGFNPAGAGAEITSLTTESLGQLSFCLPLAKRSHLDIWIRSKLASCTARVNKSLEEMDLLTASNSLADLVDSLSNWYVRRSRDRFWKSEKDNDKWSAYWTLYECLCGISLLTAPMIPFMAEELYQNLGGKLFPHLPESVHLHDWPKAVSTDINQTIETQMEIVREIASLGHAARASEKLKVRQPLAQAIVILADAEALASSKTMSAVICDELNVKELLFTDAGDKYVKYQVKANFKTLGPKLGKDMKACAAAIAQLDAASVVSKVAKGKKCKVIFSGQELELDKDDLDLRLQAVEGYTASQGSKCVVVLDTTLSPALIQEGRAREIVSKVQALRKEQDLPYEARIKLRIKCDEEISQAIKVFADYIKAETLANELSCTFEELQASTTVKIEGQEIRISLAQI